MRRFLSWMMVAAVCCSGGWFSEARAKDPEQVHVWVNGRPIPSDPPPFTENGRVLVPMRFVLEALGATVSWNNDTKTATATLGDHTMDVTQGEHVAFVDGIPFHLDVPAQAYLERTYLPLRFTGEALGGTVSWDQENRTAAIDGSREPSYDPDTLMTGVAKFADFMDRCGNMQNLKCTSGRISLEMSPALYRQVEAVLQEADATGRSLKETVGIREVTNPQVVVLLCNTCVDIYVRKVGHVALLVVTGETADYYSFGTQSGDFAAQTVDGKVYSMPLYRADRKSLHEMLEEINQTRGDGTYTVTHAFSGLSYDQIRAVKLYADHEQADPHSYLWTGYNCLEFVIEALQAGDIATPARWKYVGLPNDWFDGLHPQKF